MTRVIGVRFRTAGKIYYFDPLKFPVKKGDHVLQGQKIAEASGFVSSPIYATVSGTVKAIEPRLVVTSNGGR